jgi:hypothetical protein
MHEHDQGEEGMSGERRRGEQRGEGRGPVSLGAGRGIRRRDCKYVEILEESLMDLRVDTLV